MFLVGGCLSLGFNLAENHFIYVCLSFANDVLSRINSNGNNCNFTNLEMSEQGGVVAARFWACYSCQGPCQLLFLICCRMLSLLYSLLLLCSPLQKLTNYALLPKLWYSNGMDMNLGLEQVTNDIWNISQLAKMRKSP